MPNVRCHTRIEVITYTNQTLVKLRCSFLWGQVWTWTGPGPTPRSGSAEGQGQGQTQCGPDLEGQGQVRKIGPGPGPDRTADSLFGPIRPLGPRPSRPPPFAQQSCDMCPFL